MPKELRDYLQEVINRKASDLHLTVDSPPILRIDGNLTPLLAQPLSADDIKKMIYGVMSDFQKIQFEETRELDFSLALPNLDRFRVNVHLQRTYVEAAFRRVPIEIPTVEDLKLPSVVSLLARKINGLVLVTGPTGTGKTTTLAAMINQINMERRAMVMCIEDPIEFLHQNKKSVIKQREVYRDTNSFSEALKHCLRQDPDVIVVGEMRDLETIATALTAAETGHLVLATLHTPDASQTVERIIDVFPPHQQTQVRQQLAACLQAVVSQCLIAHSSGKGRVVATEIMLGTPAIRNLIRERSVEQIPTVIQTGAQLGMKTMDRSLKELLEVGAISLDSAMTYMKNADEFRHFFNKTK